MAKRIINRQYSHKCTIAWSAVEVAKLSAVNARIIHFHITRRSPMETPKIFESEYRFCLILWENEPINSAKLARLCNEKLGWSRTTTYTVIRRLSDRGVVKNENSVVTSLVSKDEVQAAEIDELVEKTFEGSLPAFIAAFTRRKSLSREEVAEIRQMLDRCDSDED